MFIDGRVGGMGETRGVKNYWDTKDGGRRIAANRSACLPAKLHLHNRHAVGYRSTSGVSSSHSASCISSAHALARARTHARTPQELNFACGGSFHRLEEHPAVIRLRSQWIHPSAIFGQRIDRDRVLHVLLFAIWNEARRGG